MSATLPTPASVKLSALASQADDLDALTSAAHAQIKSLEAMLGTALRSVETDAEKAEAEALAAQLEKLRVTMNERRERSGAAKQLVVKLRSFTERLPPTTAIEMGEPEEPERLGETPRETVERYRTLIAELRADAEEVRRAPLPSADVKAQALGWLDRHAALGRPHIQTQDDRVEVLFENSKALVRGDRLNAPVSADFLIWAFRDQVAAALSREIEAMPNEGALTAKERAERLEAVHTMILDNERAEEAAIERAASEGQFIARRVDASPLAILGIRIVGAAASRAA
jgi:hypothetical protein